MTCFPRVSSFSRFVLLLLMLVLSFGSGVLAEPRQAQVAGSFYPADPKELRGFITTALERYPEAEGPKPRVLILPHAGYRYSGVVAARGFRQLQGRSYEAVIVVGFTHRQTFQGASVETRDSYVTPLGSLPIASDIAAWLMTQPGFIHREEAHASGEHSMEVMLPFVQVALPDVPVVPIVLSGDAGLEDVTPVAHALAALATRGDYLFMFSTDLSHYHPYEDARKLDEAAVNALIGETPEAMDRLFRAGYVEACGRGPILASLLLGRELGYLQRRLLGYANSGDTTGEKSQGVVGYAAIGMYEPTTAGVRGGISREAGMALVRAARHTLNAHYKKSKAAPVALDEFPELQQANGMFVTLRRKGQLRGCIGRIVSDAPLATLLPTVTLDAALRDTRFPPVEKDDLDLLEVEVSVLTPPHRVQSPAEIIPGRDGVVLEDKGHSGVFLPQVWDETGWTRVEFLRELAHQKAGLDPEAWQHATLSVFQAQVFEEEPDTED